MKLRVWKIDDTLERYLGSNKDRVGNPQYREMVVALAEDYKAYAKEQVIKELEDIIIQHSNNNHIDKSHLENRIGDMRYDLKQK